VVSETESKLDNIRRIGGHWRRVLDQDVYWRPATGGMVNVADMSERWRHNAACWLLRNSPNIEVYYTLAELLVLSRPVPTVLGVREDGSDIPGPMTTLGPTPGSRAEDALDHELDLRSADPMGWMRSRNIWKRLAVGLSDHQRRTGQVWPNRGRAIG
jgi:hypothetical protein